MHVLMARSTKANEVPQRVIDSSTPETDVVSVKPDAVAPTPPTRTAIPFVALLLQRSERLSQRRMSSFQSLWSADIGYRSASIEPFSKLLSGRISGQHHDPAGNGFALAS